MSQPTAPYFLWNSSQHFFDCVTAASAAAAGTRVSRVALVKGYDSHCTIYDSEGTAWGFHFVGRKEKYSLLDRLLAKVYNPSREFPVSYSQLRHYQFAELQRAYLDAVAHDDDVLTQFVEADELTKRIKQCSDFKELFETWQWMQTDTD
jgi:hypothetical protein